MQVKVITVTFMEDEIFEGSIPQECYDNADVDIYNVEDAGEAADIIRDLGLSFSASGASWASNPDGSTIVNYARGEREEVSAHLFGPADFHRKVAALVG